MQSINKYATNSVIQPSWVVWWRWQVINMGIFPISAICPMWHKHGMRLDGQAVISTANYDSMSNLSIKTLHPNKLLFWGEVSQKFATRSFQWRTGLDTFAFSSESISPCFPLAEFNGLNFDQRNCNALQCPASLREIIPTARKKGCCLAAVSARTMIEINDNKVFDKKLYNVHPVEWSWLSALLAPAKDELWELGCALQNVVPFIPVTVAHWAYMPKRFSGFYQASVLLGQ